MASCVVYNTLLERRLPARRQSLESEKAEERVLGHPAKAGRRVAGRLVKPIQGKKMMFVAIDCQRHPDVGVEQTKTHVPCPAALRFPQSLRCRGAGFPAFLT